jgi:hypothetical protein
MAMQVHQHLSSRGFPLLYVAQALDKPVLTLENYTKWYTPMLLQPDGTVVEVEGKILSEVHDKHSDAMWIDHRFSTRFLYRLAQHLDAYIDERAIEVALGRWILEGGHDNPFYDEPEDGPEIIEV